MSDLVNPYLEINDNLKTIFIHIPKNAGISIEESLFACKIGHKTIKQFEDFDKNKFEDYWKFTVVRNPYDRLVSAFFFLKAGGRNNIDLKWSKKNLKNINNFENFVIELEKEEFRKSILSWQHFKPQYLYLLNNKEKIDLDFIARIESIEQDFKTIKKHLGINGATLKHSNKSERKNWTEYYNKKTKKIVYQIYKEDFELLNYEK